MYRCIIHTPSMFFFTHLIKVCNLSDFLFIILTQAGLMAIKCVRFSYSYSKIGIPEHCIFLSTKHVLASFMTIRPNHIIFNSKKNSEYYALLFMVKTYFWWESRTYVFGFLLLLSVDNSTRDWLAKIKRDDGRTLNGLGSCKSNIYRYILQDTFLYE